MHGPNLPLRIGELIVASGCRSVIAQYSHPGPVPWAVRRATGHALNGSMRPTDPGRSPSATTTPSPASLRTDSASGMAPRPPSRWPRGALAAAGWPDPSLVRLAMRRRRRGGIASVELRPRVLESSRPRGRRAAHSACALAVRPRRPLRVHAVRDARADSVIQGDAVGPDGSAAADHPCRTGAPRQGPRRCRDRRRLGRHETLRRHGCPPS